MFSTLTDTLLYRACMRVILSSALLNSLPRPFGSSVSLLKPFITGVINFIIGKYRIIGASNIVFMLIALSAFVNMSDRIPLTLVFIILFYFIDEVRQLFNKDGVAHYGHLTGAVCGVLFGFICQNKNLIDIIMNLFNK